MMLIHLVIPSPCPSPIIPSANCVVNNLVSLLVQPIGSLDLGNILKLSPNIISSSIKKPESDEPSP